MMSSPTLNVLATRRTSPTDGATVEPPSARESHQNGRSFSAEMHQALAGKPRRENPPGSNRGTIPAKLNRPESPGDAAPGEQESGLGTMSKRKHIEHNARPAKDSDAVPPEGGTPNEAGTETIEPTERNWIRTRTAKTQPGSIRDRDPETNDVNAPTRRQSEPSAGEQEAVMFAAIPLPVMAPAAVPPNDVSRAGGPGMAVPEEDLTEPPSGASEDGKSRAKESDRVPAKTPLLEARSAVTSEKPSRAAGPSTPESGATADSEARGQSPISTPPTILRSVTNRETPATKAEPKSDQRDGAESAAQRNVYPTARKAVETNSGTKERPGSNRSVPAEAISANSVAGAMSSAHRPSPPRPDGTASAQTAQLMKTTEEMMRSEPRSEKTVPNPARNGAVPADSAKSASTVTATSQAAPERLYAPIQISEGIYVADVAGRGSEILQSEADSSPVPSAEARLAHVQQKLMQGIVELKRSNTDAVTVVIKPDRETELSVLVHVRAGGIEVDAQCRRGDCAGWTTQWGQLQQTLALQGIRLGTLQDFTPTNLSHQSFSDGFRQAPDQDQTRRQPMPEPVSQSPRNPKLTRSAQPQPARFTAGGRRHWESWA